MQRRWINLRITEHGKTAVHTIPEDDIRVHFEAEDCHCVPLVQMFEHGTTVVHNSFDGREFTEGYMINTSWVIQ